jgi:RNA polymerase sigma-70 factor (ECF subfamily)
VDDSLDTWFKREILAHEASLLRYLGRVWPRHDEVHDLRQEIYVRIYEAANKSRPLAPRAFIFATARHLMTDRIRHGRVVSIEAVGDPDALNVLIDDLSPEHRVSAWQELKHLTHALNCLPPRCREVVWLSRVDDLTNKEVAHQLGVSIRTVEAQIRKGMRLLSDIVFGSDSCQQSDANQRAKKGSQHGER